MTNTTDKISQTIHEARGLCFHNIVHRGDVLTIPRFWCSKCPKKYPHDNPDYTSDWSAYGAALEWAQGEKWWVDFAYDFFNVFRVELITPLKGSIILAEFIDKHPEYFKKEVGR